MHAEFVDGVDEREDVIDRRFGQDAVAEIEDVAGASGGLIENHLGTAANFGRLGEQRDRIEITLNGDIVAEPRPGLGEIDAPIETDDIAAGLAH